MTVAEKLTAIAENMQKVFDAGKAEGSAGGGKVAFFDLEKLDEYEVIESQNFALVKFSDEAPTIDELMGGFFGMIMSLKDTSGDTVDRFIQITDSDPNIIIVSEISSAMLYESVYVLSTAGAEAFSVEIGTPVTAGVYAAFFYPALLPTFEDAKIALVWGV